MVTDGAVDYSKLLFRTEPFSKMASARRFQLLSQARSVRYFPGDCIFKKGQAPSEVLLLLGGSVRMLSEIPGTDEPVLLATYAPGSCVGWDVALADICSAQAVAVGEVTGMLLAAPAFLEFARYDNALRDTFLNKPSHLEVWWAVLSELHRRGLPVENTQQIVEKLAPVCVTRDWPDEAESMDAKKNHSWVVSGGEGIIPGTLWGDSSGVLWARLTGIPNEQLDRAIQGRPLILEQSLPKPYSQPKNAPDKSPTAAAAPATSSSLTFKRFASGAVFLVLSVAAVAAGLCGWASRQPTLETITTNGRLHFTGDAHDLGASVTGKLTELRIRPGQRVGKGTVLAIVQPPLDEAKAKMLAGTLARTKSQIEFCDQFLAGNSIRLADAPDVISGYMRELLALKSEHRVKSAISTGRTEDPSLTVDERAKVAAHFNALKEDRAARVDSAQQDSSIKREDLVDAEEALRDARDELRLQTQAASALMSERGDEARMDAASAQRAIAVYKRTVAARADAVARIRKEIASIRVAPAAVATSTPMNLDKLDESIRATTRRIHSFSASLRVLAVETEIAIDEMNADGAPRQIIALYPGLITATEAVEPGTPVNPDTVIGKMVTRQAWEIECPDQSIRFLKSGQSFNIVGVGPEGRPVRIKTRYAGSHSAKQKSKSLLRHKASDDSWRDGGEVQLEAIVVTGNLLDRWMSKVGTVQ